MDGRGVLIVLILLSAVIIWKAIEHRRRSARRGRILALAHRSGLDYSRYDTGNLGWLPFRFLAQGDERGIENVLHGTRDSTPVWVFDYWYIDRDQDAEGHTNEHTYRFTCARVDVPGMRFPKTRIAPETALSRLADAVGMRDLQFESDEFNRAFQIQSADRKFAYDLVDARMMRWLLLTREHDVAFEFNDEHVLLISPEVPADRFLLLAAISRDLLGKIPTVARELYRAPTVAPGEPP